MIILSSAAVDVVSWKKALEPGLKAKPVWGNGPRADNAYLTRITKTRGGEAHNDYLSVRFNYGYVGLALLLLVLQAHFYHFTGYQNVIMKIIISGLSQPQP